MCLVSQKPSTPASDASVIHSFIQKPITRHKALIEPENEHWLPGHADPLGVHRRHHLREASETAASLQDAKDEKQMRLGRPSLMDTSHLFTVN